MDSITRGRAGSAVRLALLALLMAIATLGVPQEAEAREGAPTVHICAISVGYEHIPFVSSDAIFLLLICDEFGQPVDGVLISGTISGVPVSGTTTTAGVAELLRTVFVFGTYEFVLDADGVSGAGVTYDPAANVADSATVVLASGQPTTSVPVPQGVSTTPASVAATGGATVTVNGLGLQEATTVTVDGQAVDFTATEDGRLTFVAPAALPVGEVEVEVTAPGGSTSVTLQVTAGVATVTTLAGDGPGSFREAIEMVNGDPLVQMIVFDPGINLEAGGEIRLSDALRPVTADVEIDASTLVSADGSPRITLNGSGVANASLRLLGASSTVKGLGFRNLDLEIEAFAEAGATGQITVDGTRHDAATITTTTRGEGRIDLTLRPLTVVNVRQGDVAVRADLSAEGTATVGTEGSNVDGGATLNVNLSAGRHIDLNVNGTWTGSGLSATYSGAGTFGGTWRTTIRNVAGTGVDAKFDAGAAGTFRFLDGRVSDAALGLKFGASLGPVRASVEVNRSVFDGAVTGIFGIELPFENTGNTFVNNTTAGIVLDGALGTISGDTFSGNGSAIILRGNANATISSNTISDSRGPGIVVGDTSTAAVSNNSIERSGGPGVQATPSATVTLDGNTFIDNSGDDLEVREATRVLTLSAGTVGVGYSGDVATDPAGVQAQLSVPAALDTIWQFREGGWLSFRPSAPAFLNTLSTVDPLAPLLFVLSAPAEWTGPLGVFDARTVSVDGGFTAVTYTGPDGAAPADVLAQFAGTGAVEALFAFDNSTHRWRVFRAGAPAFLNDLTALQRFDVVFVLAASPTTWNIPAGG